MTGKPNIPKPHLEAVESEYVGGQSENVGNRPATVLPKEVLAQLKLVKGDSLILTECPGAFRSSEVTREQRKFFKS